MVMPVQHAAKVYKSIWDVRSVCMYVCMGVCVCMFREYVFSTLVTNAVCLVLSPLCVNLNILYEKILGELSESGSLFTIHPLNVT